MKKFALVALSGLIGGTALIASIAPASAMIACNRRGDCWHVQDGGGYRPEFGVTMHPDDWRWGRHEHFRFREHDGRGYWRGDRWVTF